MTCKSVYCRFVLLCSVRSYLYLILGLAKLWSVILCPVLLLAEDSTVQDIKSEKILQQAVEAREQVGVTIGMPKSKVFELLGDKYQEEKISNLMEDESVYTWHRPNDEFVSVTFSSDKVKGVSQRLYTEGLNNASKKTEDSD